MSLLQRQVVAAFAVALAILAGVATISFRSLHQVRETMEVVSHTQETNAALARLLAHITDIETGQRGYVITGEDRFLEPFEHAEREVERTVAQLRDLLLDDATLWSRVDVLLRELESKRAFSRAVVEVRRKDADSAASMVSAGAGRLAMDAVRIEIRALQQHETRLLEVAEASLYESLERARSVSVAGFVLAVLISLLAMIAVRRDIGRREAAEHRAIEAKEEAEAANRAKSDFLARMSHELRTPLNSVIGFSGVLLKNKGGNLRERDLSYLDRIQINGRHLLGLINDVLDLSKIEAQKVEMQLAPLMLDALIRDTIAQFDERTAGKPVVLRTDLPAVVAPIEADAGKLKQVLINLIANALKFTDRGAVKVLLFVADDGRPLRIDVIDTGIGIPKHRLEAIFAAFEQADRSITQRFGGTGLGLTISRALCTLMRYRLEVRSVVGKGTTFSVLLTEDAPLPRPMGSSDDGVPEAEGGADETILPSPSGEGRASVLVIDDEADSRTLLGDLLEDAGYVVRMASSAEDGLRLMRESRPDVVTLDLLMHPVAGADVLRSMQAEPVLASIPVVVVSVTAEEARPWADNEVARVCKPVVREELLEALARAAEHMPAPRTEAAAAA